MNYLIKVIRFLKIPFTMNDILKPNIKYTYVGNN